MVAKYDILLEEYKNSDEKIINYVKNLWISLWDNFNIELLKRAFTHKSFSNDVHKKLDSNERLEFLWDSILWFVVADNLYHEKNIMQEDMMSLYKISLVNEKILAQVAREINAWDYIFLWLWELNSVFIVKWPLVHSASFPPSFLQSSLGWIRSTVKSDSYVWFWGLDSVLPWNDL